MAKPKFKVGQLLNFNNKGALCWELIKITEINFNFGQYIYFCIDKRNNSFGLGTIDDFDWVEERYNLIVNYNNIWNTLNG